MTAAPAEPLCSHRWQARVREPNAHRCILPADHLADEPTTSHRCHCGAVAPTAERATP